MYGLGPRSMTSQALKLETHLKPAVGVMLKGKLAETTKFQHHAHDLFALCNLVPVPWQIRSMLLACATLPDGFDPARMHCGA